MIRDRQALRDAHQIDSQMTRNRQALRDADLVSVKTLRGSHWIEKHFIALIRPGFLKKHFVTLARLFVRTAESPIKV